MTTGIGLGVQALGRAGLQYAQRRTHRAEQNRIAAAAAPLPVGGTAAWHTNHTIPVEPNERGQVAVSRVISSGLLDWAWFKSGWLLLGSGVVGGTSRDQACDEGTEQGFAAPARVVHDLEEAEIQGQLVLRDAPVRAQPRAQQ